MHIGSSESRPFPRSDERGPISGPAPTSAKRRPLARKGGQGRWLALLLAAAAGPTAMVALIGPPAKADDQPSVPGRASRPATRPDAAYDPMLNESLRLLTVGRIDEMLKALDFTPANAGREGYERVRDALLDLKANAGPCDGFDVAVVHPLTPRLQVAFAFAYYQRGPALLRIQLYHVNGRWRARGVDATTDLEPFLQTLPIAAVRE